MNYCIIDAHQMSDEKKKEYLKKITNIAPKILYGYVSTIEDLADFIKNNNFEPPKIGAIVTSAEKLFAHQKKKIEGSFNCKVYDQYGSTEIGGIAGMCPTNSGFHISSEHVIVEIINENKHEKEQEIGEIVITDLDNFKMPLIRYKIGDLSSFGDKCKCGRNHQILNSIFGRTTDIIIGKNGNKVHGEYFSHLIESTSFDEKYGIEQFQVKLSKGFKLEILLKTNHNNPKIDFKIFTKHIIKDLGDLSIEYKIVKEIEKSKSGKMKFVINEMK
jgi:phenylacetate-CoA ligase